MICLGPDSALHCLSILPPSQLQGLDADKIQQRLKMKTVFDKISTVVLLVANIRCYRWQTSLLPYHATITLSSYYTDTKR